MGVLELSCVSCERGVTRHLSESDALLGSRHRSPPAARPGPMQHVCTRHNRVTTGHAAHDRSTLIYTLIRDRRPSPGRSGDLGRAREEPHEVSVTLTARAGQKTRNHILLTCVYTRHSSSPPRCVHSVSPAVILPLARPCCAPQRALTIACAMACAIACAIALACGPAKHIRLRLGAGRQQ